MFFLLSKLLDIGLDPVWWALVLLVVSLVFTGRSPRLSRAGMAGALLFIAVPSTPVTAEWLWSHLEANASNSFRPEVSYDVVVLLGGVVQPSGSVTGSPAYGDSVERLTTVFDLLRTGKAQQAILSGGYLSAQLPAEAQLLKEQLVSWGIDEKRLVLEERSRNTHDNATGSAALIRSHHFSSVLLVTSAFHMQRAQGCFKAEGLSFDTLPVDYRLRNPSHDASWLPRAEYLGQTTAALRELAGRAVYQLLGYSK